MNDRYRILAAGLLVGICVAHTSFVAAQATAPPVSPGFSQEVQPQSLRVSATLHAPQQPAPLAVKGWEAASHVAPDGPLNRAWPVVVVLHGNFDRPEWECALWKEVAGFYGWVLCPRGVRSRGATRAQDRWTYASRPAAKRETEAALQALEVRYPGRVSREGMVLAGLSLGAIMAPNIAREEPGKWSLLFLIEGGMNKLLSIPVPVLEKVGVRGVGLAMSGKWRRRRASKFVKTHRETSFATAFVDMEGAGHTYSHDFESRGRAALLQLLQKAGLVKHNSAVAPPQQK